MMKKYAYKFVKVKSKIGFDFDKKVTEMENEWNVYAYFRFIHKFLILEDGCVLFPIIISLSENLIWLESIYFSLSFISI